MAVDAPAAGLLVLDVPEFAPLRLALARCHGVDCGPVGGGYWLASSRAPIEVRREQTGLCEAVWFGAATAGCIGTIECLDSERLRIVPAVVIAEA